MMGVFHKERKETEPRQDWIATCKWVQATPFEGMWDWTLWFVNGTQSGLKVNKVEEGLAFTKLGVYFKVWRACRAHKLRFKPWPWSKTWVSGEF